MSLGRVDLLGRRSKRWRRRKESQIRGYADVMRDNPTVAEERLWQIIRVNVNNRVSGVFFERQVHKLGTSFILDFYCSPLKFAIEVDGGYHGSSDQRLKDLKRDRLLSQSGIRVLRFTNEEVLGSPLIVLNRIEHLFNFLVKRRGSF